MMRQRYLLISEFKIFLIEQGVVYDIVHYRARMRAKIQVYYFLNYHEHIDMQHQSISWKKDGKKQ